MNKSLSLVISLILFSCTKENIQDPPINDAESTFVTEAMAIAQVEEFISQLDFKTKGMPKKSQTSTLPAMTIERNLMKMMFRVRLYM